MLDSSTHLTSLSHLRHSLLELLAESEDEEASRVFSIQESPIRSSPSGASITQSRSVDDTRSARAAKGQQMLESVTYCTITVVVVTLCTMFSLHTALVAQPGTYTKSPVTHYVLTLLLVYFVFDCGFKVYLLRSRYLKNEWNRLDLFLTMLGVLALVIEIVQHGAVMEILDTPLPQLFDALTVCQLLRVHQFFRAYYVAARYARRHALSTADPVQAGRVQAFTVLLKFTHAQVDGQDKLMKYFGRGGRVESGIVARCFVESLTDIYRASVWAWHMRTLISPDLLASLKDLDKIITATDKLCHQIEEAHTCGVLNEQEAESLCHPMTQNLKAFHAMVKDRHMGIFPVGLSLDDDTSEGSPRPERSDSRGPSRECSQENLGGMGGSPVARADSVGGSVGLGTCLGNASTGYEVVKLLGAESPDTMGRSPSLGYASPSIGPGVSNASSLLLPREAVGKPPLPPPPPPPLVEVRDFGVQTEVQETASSQSSTSPRNRGGIQPTVWRSSLLSAVQERNDDDEARSEQESSVLLWRNGKEFRYRTASPTCLSPAREFRARDVSLTESEGVAWFVTPDDHSPPTLLPTRAISASVGGMGSPGQQLYLKPDTDNANGSSCV